MAETIEVVPVVMPQFHWPAIRDFTIDHCGKDATLSGDAAKIDLDEMAVFIATLIGMGERNINMLSRLREPNGLLKHLFAGFMFNIPEMQTQFYLLQHTDLVATGKGVGFISGTMFDWHKAIIKLCKFGKPYGVRLFFNICLLHFDKGGMRQFFEHYGRDGLPDGTFELRLK